MANEHLRFFYVILSVYFVLGYQFDGQMPILPEYWTTQKMIQETTPELAQIPSFNETNKPSYNEDATRDISRQSELFSMQLFQVILFPTPNNLCKINI